MNYTIETIKQVCQKHFKVKEINQHVIGFDFFALLCYELTGLKPYFIFTELGITSNTLYKFRTRAAQRIEKDGMKPVYTYLVRRIKLIQKKDAK